MKKIIAVIKNSFKEHSTPSFKYGLILLLVNPVVGLVVSPLLVAVGTCLFNFSTGMAIGIGVYVFSWLLLGIGVILAGKPGYLISKKIFREIRSDSSEKNAPPSA